MYLNPKKMEKIMLHYAGELAKKRKERGVKLNYSEAVSLICSELMEAARDGKTVRGLAYYGTQVIKQEDVMNGIAEMVKEVQIEAAFPDGMKLVTVHNPIR